MLLRIDDIAVIAVLNDSRASLGVVQETLKKIAGPLSPLQLREIMVRMAAINIRLAERPRFSSSLDLLTEAYEISGESTSEIRVEDMDADRLGQMMFHICGP